MADPKTALIDALRAAMADLDVDVGDVERRLGWREGTFETLREHDTHEVFDRAWIALLILLLERFDRRLRKDEPYAAFAPIRSDVHESASRYEAFEGDATSVSEVTDPAAGRRRRLESSPLVLSREVAEPLLELLYRMYRFGGGEEVEPFDEHVRTLAKRVQRRGS